MPQHSNFARRLKVETDALAEFCIPIIFVIGEFSQFFG